MAQQALIYTRVSQDRAGGRSTDQQEDECRRVCEREGWDVALVVTDFAGASRRSKGSRPGWEQVLATLATGTIDVMVTWESSRAQRDLRSLAALRDLCEKNRVKWSYKGRTYDLAETNDRFSTAIDGAVAERESDEISDRVSRAMRASAAEGRPPGRRLFGYERRYDTTNGRLLGQEPHRVEAPVVHSIFSDYLAGEGIRTIARRLNDRGATTGTGAQWTDVQVRRVLKNPAYAAQRVHRSTVIGPASWPPLVDDNTFDRVQARMAAASSGPRRSSTSRLLTGVGRCGKCGGRLNAGHDRRQRKVYQCRENFCVARDLVKLDYFVTEVVLARLSRPDVQEALDSDATDPVVEEARVRIASRTQRLHEAQQLVVKNELTLASFIEIENGLRASIEEDERIVRQSLVPLDVELPPTNLEDWWAALSAEVRREVLSTVIAAVRVNPTKRGSRSFDMDAVKVEFRR